MSETNKDFWLTQAGLALAGAAWLIAMLSCAPAEAVEIHGVAHGISHHFQERTDGKAQEYNERNFGAGLRIKFDADLSLQFGAYRNSIGRNSAYLIGDYTPLHLGVLSAGVFGGVASGYEWKTVAGLTGVAGAVARAQISDWSVTLRATPKHPKASAVVALEIGYRF